MVMILAYCFVSTIQDIKLFIKIYLIFCIPFSLSVFLSYHYGDTYFILKDVGSFIGKELIIYDLGTILKSYSGLFRTGEVAAWHSGSAICFLIILSFNKRSSRLKILSAVLIPVLIWSILMTGRRKMLMSVLIYFALYSYFLFDIKRNIAKHTFIVYILISLWYIIYLLIDFITPEQELYFKRGGSVFEGTTDRIKLSFHLLYAAICSHGLMGAGAGVSVHGSDYFGGGWQLGGAAESGLGKLGGELGMPGLIAIVLLVVRFIKIFFNKYRKVLRNDQQLGIIISGLFCFLVANVATFVAAAQLFGDPFILFIIGWMTGCILAGLTKLTKSKKSFPMT
jgi:hypothetical protein